MKVYYRCMVSALLIGTFSAQAQQIPGDLDRERDFMLVKSEIVSRLGEEYRGENFHFNELSLNREVMQKEYLYSKQGMYNPYQYPSIGQLFYKKKDLYEYVGNKIRDHEYWVMYTAKFMSKFNLREYDSFVNFSSTPFSARFEEFLNAERLEIDKWKQINQSVHQDPMAYLLSGPLHPHKISGVDQIHGLEVDGKGAKAIVWDCGFVNNEHVNFKYMDEHVKHPENGDKFDRNDMHGTHVAGIIAADAESGDKKGVAYGAEILPVEFMGVDNLIERIKDSDAKVISASFHYLVDRTEIRDFDKLADELEKHDRILVMASGNDSKFISPELNPNFFTYWTRGVWMGTHNAWILSKNQNLAKRILLVGSLKEDGHTISRFSNLPGVMPQSFVFAPGENILSTVAFNKFENMSGTSMATPHVSGIIALLNKYYPTLTALELKDCITGTCDRFWEEQESGLGYVAYNPQIFGQGRVNAVRAFKMAETLSQAKAATEMAKKLSAPVAA